MAKVKKRTGNATPGPWSDDEGNCITADFGSVGICILEPIEEFWCGDAARHPSGREHVANARLIAAAPDLLAACQEVIKQGNANPDENDPDAWTHAEITRSAIEAVFAAVRKAVG